MESKKLEKKIRDWASDLSFKLPDGSAPPANYFALLTATPHRRRLWETLIESIQPRQKVEHMRKQIVVAKLRERKKFSKKSDSSLPSDRIELWHKQNALEHEIKEKRNETIKLERDVLTKMSDVLFEICKLAELEKLYEESSEKTLALRLFTKREKDMMERLERILMRANSCCEYNSNSSEQKNLDFMENERLMGECKQPFDCGDDCEVVNKLKKLHESGMTDQFIWDEVIKRKKSLLNKFSEFLEELNSNEKNILREKEAEVEKNLNESVTQLKQKMTEKSLQVILSSTERQALDWQIEKLMQTLLEEPIGRVSHNGTFSEVTSSPLEMSGCLVGSEKAAMNLKNYLNVVGLRSYEAFLREESNRLEEEMRKNGRKEGLKEAEQEIQVSLETFASSDCIVDEINTERAEEREIAAEIPRKHGNLLRGLQSLRDEAELQNRARGVEDADKLKSASGKMMDVFLDTPLNAFRTVESCPGRLLFECESLSHCLNNYGGELKQFFSAMLIFPVGDSQAVLSEIERRKKMLSEIGRVIRGREKLAQQQREIQQRMGSMKLDRELCERNFKESDDILWNVLLRSEELLRGTELMEKILKNWVEQPYRFMVKEALVEKT